MPLYYVPQFVTTTLNVGGGINNSQTTGIILSSVTGIDITKPGIALLTYTDPLNTSNCEWVTYTSINGSNELQGVTRGAEGYAAKSHNNNCTIAFPVSKSHINNINDALLAYQNGWTTDANTWTYVSVSTFTISGDYTSIYKKGTKIRFKQGGGYKYATLAIDSTYSAPNTTVTIVVNTDYTIANAAITDNYYSYDDRPVDFPSKFAFTCAPFGSGGSAGTFAQTSNTAYFNVTGGVCKVWATGKITDKGSWSGSVYLNLPIAPAGLISLGGGGFIIAEGGLNTVKAVVANTNTSPSIIQFNKTFLLTEPAWSDLAVNDVYSVMVSYPL